MKILAPAKQALIYVLIALQVGWRYLFRLPPGRYMVFMRRASILLWAFRHNRPIRVRGGFKLQLYLPAWPSRAFFEVLENKLLSPSPRPASLVFSMTRACGYSCPHCYQKLENKPDLPEELLLQTLRESLNAGVRFFNIEGGEPFRRFERLLAMLEIIDRRAEVWVNTTGDGVSPDLLKQAYGLGLSGLMVSIHSPRREIHDGFTRAPGSFEKACRCIETAKSLNLAAAVNSVLGEDEIRSGGLDGLMSLARKLRADYVQLIHPKPCGGWLFSEEERQTDEQLLKEIEAAHLRYNSWPYSDYPSLAAQVFEERSQGFGCTAGGVDRFYISSSGEVLPCEFLQISFGNVQDEAFADIFERMRDYFAVPGSAWLCCERSRSIAEYMKKHGLESTPLPWPHSRALIDGWPETEATALYARLGIYQR